MNPTNTQPVTFQGNNIPAQGTPAYAQAQQGIVPQGFGGAVTSASLAPSNPINIPPTPTQPPPITSYVPPPAGTVVNNGIATVPPPAVQTPPQSAYQGILSKLGIQGDALAQKADVTKQLQDQYQLSQKTEQAAKDYNAYLAAREGMNQGIATMSTTNPGNLPADSRQQEISDYQLKKSFEVANYSIAAQGSQGLLSAAQQTIKDKLDAQFGPVEDQINYLTKFAQLNQNDLSESEKTQLQAQIEQKKTEAANVQTAAQDIHDRLAQNNAPTSVYSSLDKIVSDFTNGKITAQDAQNQMYQAAGKYGAVNKYTSVNTGYDVNGNPIYSAFDTTTGTYGNGSHSITPGFNQSNSQKPVTFEQYGLLSKTDFNSSSSNDNRAYNYLQSYLTNGEIPTSNKIGISSRGQQATIEFDNASKRAKDLYFAATGQPLPTPQIVANNIKLINTNNDVANKVLTQEQTVRANVDLSLSNMTKNGLNSSSFAPLNGLIDSVKLAFNDPAVGQFLSQNSTIQNELGSLLAVKNASGTTVFDKLQSAGIINSTDTKENIKQKVDTLIQEAGNFSSAITSINGDLYKKIDPLMLNPDNPNRQATLNVGATNNPTSATINSTNTKINGLTVTLPNGQQAIFPDQFNLEKFKSQHGLH